MLEWSYFFGLFAVTEETGSGLGSGRYFVRVVDAGHGAGVGVGEGEVDIPERNAVHVTQVEAPYRELAEHGEFGVVRGVLGDGGLGAGWVRAGAGGAGGACAGKGIVGETAGGRAAGVGDVDVFEGQVLDAVAGEAGDGGGEDAMLVGQRGAFHRIAFVGFAGGNFDVDVGDADVLDRAVHRILVAMTETDEEGVAGVFGFYVPDVDLGQASAVDGFECDGRTVGIIDGEVFHCDMMKTAAAGSAKFERACAASDPAMFDIDVIAAIVAVFRFETDAVIVGIEEAVGQPDVFAVDEIDAIVVPERIAFDLDAVDDHVATAFVILDPVECVLYSDSADGEAIAMIEEDDLRTVFFRGPHLAPGIGLLPFVIVDLACFYPDVEVLEQGVAAAIDGARTLDGDAGLPTGFEQREGMAWSIVHAVSATQQVAVLGKLEGDV